MNRLRELRIKKKKTIVEVATETSIAKSTIARLETENVSIKSDIAQILATYYNVSIDYLLGVETHKDDSIKVAFYNQEGIVTEEQQKMVEDFIAMIKRVDSK